jgi:bacteriorhodopsin
VKPVLGKRRAVQVRVTSRGGQTRIHIQERLFELAWTIFPTVWGLGAGGIGAILGIGLGVPVGAPEVAALLAAGWTGGMYALSRKIFSYVSRKKRTDLQRLSERIAEIAAESTRDRLDGGQTTRALPGST